jgi:hypothetical protein
MMQSIEVSAVFSPEGKITPLRFRWRGGVHMVESTGRHWQEEDGCHILVMTAGGQMVELLFAPLESRWYLVRSGPDPWAV